MDPQVARSNRVALPLAVLIYLYYFLLPFSVSIGYVIAYAYFFINKKFHIPKDFILFILLYIIRAISLIFNNLSVLPIKEIFDKFVYVIFSNISINEKIIDRILFSIFFSNFIILVVGIFDRFLPMFWTKYYYVYVNEYNLKLDKKDKVVIRNIKDKPIEIFINENKILVPGNSVLTFLKLKEGNYTISSTDSFFLHTKQRISENYIFIKRFWNETNNFEGPFGHKLVASGVFSTVSVLFFCAFIFYKKIYFFAFLISFISLILTFSKSYIPIVLLILTTIFLTKYKNPRLILFPIILFFSISLFLLIFNPAFNRALELRKNFYMVGLEIFQKSPIFGIGYNHVSDYLKDYAKLGIIDNFSHTHNIYTDALAETGILGFLAFIIAYIYFAIKFLKKGYSENNFLAISGGWIVVLMLISGFFEKNLDRVIIDLFVFSILGLSNIKLSLKL